MNPTDSLEVKRNTSISNSPEDDIVMVARNAIIENLSTDPNEGAKETPSSVGSSENLEDKNDPTKDWTSKDEVLHDYCNQFDYYIHVLFDLNKKIQILKEEPIKDRKSKVEALRHYRNQFDYYSQALLGLKNKIEILEKGKESTKYRQSKYEVLNYYYLRRAYYIDNSLDLEHKIRILEGEITNSVGSTVNSANKENEDM